MLARPKATALAEPAARNILYLWLVSGIVSIGLDDVMALTIFTTLRWGLVMVPLQGARDHEPTSLHFLSQQLVHPTSE